MIRRLAAAILFAAVSFPASMDGGAAVVDFDDTAGGTMTECIEYRRTSAEKRRLNVFSATCTVCQRPIEHAWLVRDAHGPLAAATVQAPSDHLAVVSLAVGSVANTMLSAIVRKLLSPALSWCRDSGALKVIIESEKVPWDLVISVARDRGFQFVGSRRSGDGVLLQFYTDLYWHQGGIRRL